jgi:hypothetical protein
MIALHVIAIADRLQRTAAAWAVHGKPLCEILTPKI